MRTLITGSLAFDSIMVFPDQFKNHILPDQTHILNVCFLVPEMRREYGGCAGNIAYGLKMLGGEPVIMAAAGADFSDYSKRLADLDINSDHIRIIDDSYTAQAYITTDLDDNQIIAFHPGAMNFAHHNKISDASDIGLGILGPDGRDGMIEHAAQFVEAKIPFIFDPGQGLPMFNGEELMQFVEQADYVIVNDYESKMMEEKTGKSFDALAENVKAFIVTLGGEGSQIYTGGDCITVPAATIDTALDPTGCGDAYRSGLLYGLSNQLDWPTTGRIAALMGAMKIETKGPQNYIFDKSAFNQRFTRTFDDFAAPLA